MYNNKNLSITTNSVDRQMGELLAFVILFEKKIQQLRIKLAGNEQFHSRLAFQLIDSNRKCNLSAEDLLEAINRYGQAKSIQEVEGFCRKYTANGWFSYDEFIKFMTPRTNKILAQRLMIRTYRQGTVLPSSVVGLLAETLSTAVTMTTVTQNLRRKLMANNQLTHLEILELFKKCCTSKEKLFYFINASTNDQRDYDFALDQMDFLVYHVKGNCELQDISDQQIKQILCPLDMNYQKHPYNKTGFGNTFASNNRQSKTDYFKTKSSFNNTQGNINNKVSSSENDQPFIKTATVNFLKTNYQQTSKNFYKQNINNGNINNNRPGVNNNNLNKMESREMFLQPLDENVQTKPPTPMMNQKNFPANLGYAPYLVLDQYNLPTSKSHQQGSALNSATQQHDASQVSSINYGNMYIEKFARGQNQNPIGLGYPKKAYESHSRTQLDNLLIAKYEHERKKQVFYDQFNNKHYTNFEDSDNMSADSAFMQY